VPQLEQLLVFGRAGVGGAALAALFAGGGLLFFGFWEDFGGFVWGV
jgi:hypothetical protein